MKKMLLWVMLAGVSVVSPIVFAEGNNEDPALVAASYQQGEATDPASPVTNPPSTQNVPAPVVAVSSNNDFSQITTGLMKLAEQQEALQKQLDNYQYLLLGLAALWLALSIVLLVINRKDKLPAPAAETVTPPGDNDEDTQSEYDFMGSREAIPAKLDLAAGLYRHGRFSAARETLTEI